MTKDFVDVLRERILDDFSSITAPALEEITRKNVESMFKEFLETQGYMNYHLPVQPEIDFQGKSIVLRELTINPSKFVAGSRTVFLAPEFETYIPFIVVDSLECEGIPYLRGEVVFMSRASTDRPDDEVVKHTLQGNTYYCVPAYSLDGKLRREIIELFLESIEISGDQVRLNVKEEHIRIAKEASGIILPQSPKIFTM